MDESITALLETAARQRDSCSNVVDPQAFDINAPPDDKTFYVRPELISCLDRLMAFERDRIRDSLLVLGPSGSGKTASVRQILRGLQTRNPDLYVIHYVNCRDATTSYQVMRQGLNEPRWIDRLSLQAAWRNQFSGDAKLHILVLDECDMLWDDDIFYDLSRHEAYDRTFLILITKSPKFFSRIGSDVQSSLRLTTVHFDHYAPNQITEILSKRAAIGLKEIDPGIIAYVSAVTVHEARGDARVAITVCYDLFKNTPIPTSDMAEWSNVQKEVIKRVSDAYQNLKGLVLRGLTEQKRLICYTALLKKDSGLAYTHCSGLNNNAISRTTFWRNLRELEMMDLLQLIPYRRGRSTVLQVRSLLSEENTLFLADQLRASYDIEPPEAVLQATQQPIDEV